ncbi:hypothetical protein MQM1_081 [Aeromonas phage vB_AsaP_MQM1]|nr:hypothetical protein MQM1_081 [Aeromonas phage vB_AsaP_MQM1]
MKYIAKPWEYQLDIDQAIKELQAERDANIIPERQYREELAALYLLKDGRK